MTAVLASTFSETTLPLLIITGCLVATATLGLVRLWRRRHHPAAAASGAPTAGGAPPADDADPDAEPDRLREAVPVPERAAERR